MTAGAMKTPQQLMLMTRNQERDPEAEAREETMNVESAERRDTLPRIAPRELQATINAEIVERRVILLPSVPSPRNADVASLRIIRCLSVLRELQGTINAGIVERRVTLLQSVPSPRDADVASLRIIRCLSVPSQPSVETAGKRVT